MLQFCSVLRERFISYVNFFFPNIHAFVFQCAINCPQHSDLLLILITEATFKEAIYACMIVTKSLFTSNAR